MFTERQRNLFPELNLPSIKQHVETLAAEYPGSLRRVTLNRFSDREHKYLLAFELSSNKKSRIALLNSMALELTGYEKHLPAFYLDRKACNERDWLFLPVYKRDPDYSEMTIEGGGLVLYESEARGGCHNIPQHTTLRLDRNGFYREADFWRIVYNGKETTVRDLDGLYYLGYLLANPGRTTSARELYFARRGQPVDSVSSVPGELSTRSVFIDSDDPEMIRVLKREAKKAYHNLKIAQQQGNEARIKKREDDYERIKQVLKNHGLSVSEGNGRLIFRRVKPANKYTDSVRKAVGLAKDKLIKEIPELKKHLNCIQRKGNELIYIPLETDETEFIFRP